LFLYDKLSFDKDESTALYHSNEFVLSIFTIIGAIIADAFLGIYRTIAIMTLVTAIGSSILLTGSLEISSLPNKFVKLKVIKID
jgi:dipeptide/tripeptide permease